MPATLSIRNVPDEIAERLRERARRHHRSVQGEVMAILEDAVVEPPKMTAAAMVERARKPFGGKTMPNESLAMLREARKEREEHLERLTRESR